MMLVRPRGGGVSGDINGLASPTVDSGHSENIELSSGVSNPKNVRKRLPPLSLVPDPIIVAAPVRCLAHGGHNETVGSVAHRLRERFSDLECAIAEVGDGYLIDVVDSMRPEVERMLEAIGARATE